jgi:hypothetical protein
VLLQPISVCNIMSYVDMQIRYFSNYRTLRGLKKSQELLSSDNANRDRIVVSGSFCDWRFSGLNFVLRVNKSSEPGIF